MNREALSRGTVARGRYAVAQGLSFTLGVAIGWASMTLVGAADSDGLFQVLGVAFGAAAWSTYRRGPTP